MGREVVEQDNQFAVRETVSGEEILTPWFQTKQELAEHLITHGDSWGSGPVSREAAEKFVEVGFVPSFAIVGGRFRRAYECALL